MFDPKTPVQVSPKDYEEQVVRWLNSKGSTLIDFKVEALKMLEGDGGDYELDAVATLSILGGAEITILIECKRYNRKVEREKVMVLWAKLDALKAHKGMIFSTSGFQAGAIEYASDKGIATITFVDEKSLYMTKSMHAPEPDLSIPAKGYAGILIRKGEGSTFNALTIDSQHLGPIADWLNSQ